MGYNLQGDQPLQRVLSLQQDQGVQPYPALQRDQRDLNLHGDHGDHPYQRDQRSQGVQQYPERGGEGEWVNVRCMWVSGREGTKYKYNGDGYCNSVYPMCVRMFVCLSFKI